MGAADKEPVDLTEMEKVALAYAAGLPYRTAWTEDGKMRVDIINLFAVTKTDGKFVVHHREQPKGDRLRLQKPGSESSRG